MVIKLKTNSFTNKFSLFKPDEDLQYIGRKIC